MAVHVDEMTTDVAYEPAPVGTTSGTAESPNAPQSIERARRAATRAERIARRTRAEGHDD